MVTVSLNNRIVLYPELSVGSVAVLMLKLCDALNGPIAPRNLNPIDFFWAAYFFGLEASNREIATHPLNR